MTFEPSAHGDTPPPLRHADVLNEWSLIFLCLVVLKENTILVMNGVYLSPSFLAEQFDLIAQPRVKTAVECKRRLNAL